MATAEISRRPADRYYSPDEAARVAAQYLDFDPAFFLDQTIEADMLLVTDGQNIHHVDFFDTGATDKKRFLWAWMKEARGGKALRELMLKRGLTGEVAEV